MLTLIKQYFWNKKIKLWCKVKCLLAGVLVINCVYANPIDGVVSAGKATINSQPNYMEITQQSERAVIDWGKFDIGANEHTNFQQPSSNAVTLNRIHSDEASNINGRLTANGKLILINQNGIMFGRDAKVDVNGLLATTSNISNQRFMAGVNKQRQLLFDQAGSADAAIVNEGEINAAKGLVGLVAPRVVNTGIITAKLGKVALATGDQFTVDLYGDKLLNIAVSDEQRKQLLINAGEIIADGGEILLTGSAGKKIVNNLIINSGVLAARHVEERDGKIIIFAEGSNAVKGNVSKAKGKKQGQSGVLIKGLVDVSGLNRGEKGGKLQISGDEVVITDAIINASGYEGKAGTTVGLEKSAKRIGSAGGEILIGGDYLGKGKIPAARQLLVDRDVVIFNDAIDSGDAGRNIFWSDGVTSFYGKVFARALGGKGLGSNRLSSHGTGEVDGLSELRREDGSGSANPILGGNLGDGGFVETSGKKKLDAGGYVNLLASNGTTGTYLLDPSTVNIYGNFDPKFVSTDGSLNLSNDLAMWLDFSDQSNIQLSYQNVLSGTTDAPVSITTIAASGASTLTVTNTTNLRSGARIQLGATGIQNANVTETPDGQAANNTNIYTITNISGSTLTITPQLKQNYAVNTILYQGYVSTAYDKSGGNNNGSAISNNNRVLWIVNNQNNLGTINFFRGVEFLSISNSATGMDYIKNQTNFTYLISGRSTGSGITHYFCVGNSILPTDYLILFRPHLYPPYQIAINGVNVANFGDNFLTGNSNSHIIGVYNNYDNSQVGVYVDGSLSANSSQSFKFKFADMNPAPNVHFLGARSLKNTPGLTAAEFFRGYMYEAIEYKAALIDSTRNLLEQYKSSKWNIPLLSNPTTSYNAGLDGVSNLTSDYLMKLSTSADVSILADNVNLDLKNSTLNIADDKNLNITARSSLQVPSVGTITTNKTTIGGNISIQLYSGNLDLTNLTLNANNDAAINITASAGSITAGTMSGGSILLQAQGSSSDITIPTDKTLTTTSTTNNHPLILVAGRNFYNNNPASSTVLTTANNTYWRIYSNSPTNNIGTEIEYLGSSDIKSNINYNSNSVPTDLSNLLIYSTNVRTLDITPNISNVPLTYGDPLLNIINQITSYTYSGYIDPDVAADDTITGSPSITSNYHQGSNIGSYSLTISKGTLQSALNYDFSTKTIDAFVQVNPKLLTVYLTGEVAKTYDGTLDATLTASNYTNVDANATLTNGAGVVGADIVNLTGYTNGFYSIKDVGMEKTITVSSLGVDNSNYIIGNTLSSNIGTINPKDLHINADPITKTYGDSDPPLTYSVSEEDLVSGETIDIIQGELTRVAGNIVGTYPITINSTNPISAPNYSIVYTGADFTINPITITINNPNYLFNFVSGDFTISPRPVTITADPAVTSKTYGDPDPELTYVVTSGNLVGTDSLNVSFIRNIGENVVNSPYAINLDRAVNPNYNLTYVPGYFTITPRAIKITPDPDPLVSSKVYGAADPTLTYKITEGNLVGTDDLNVSLSRAIGENVVDSPYAINLNGVVNPNYALTYVSGNFTIDPRAIEVTANPASKTYGNSDPTLTYQITKGNLVGTDILNIKLIRAAGENATSTTNLPYVIDFERLNNSNYALTYVSDKFTINPRPIKVKADAVGKVYGESDPSFTYQITEGNLVGTDTLKGRLKRVAGEEVAGSPYDINIGNLNNSNYALSYEGAKFTINPRVITIQVDPVVKTYGDPDPTFTYKIIS